MTSGPRSALLLPLFLVGCSSEAATTGSGPCAERSGSYVTHYVEVSGSCGDPGVRVENVSSQPTSVSAPCAGSISYSPDNCEVTYDTSCPEDGVAPGTTLRIVGKSRWNADGSEGNATEQWTLTSASGTTMCLSTYNVSSTRQ